jgi:DNA polymerase I-like protein with 3'-5' exonuclease and polymerase domains/uracil-DNA glycosylase
MELGWHPLGIERKEVRIENVCETRPQGNHFEAFAPTQVAWWQRNFHARLSRHQAEKCVVVPTGNVALNTIRRGVLPTKGSHWRLKGGLIDWGDRIGNWRGSIFPYTTEDGRVWKVVPTIHPAALYRNPLNFDDWQADWRRIAREAERPGDFPEEGDDRVVESVRELVELQRFLAGLGRDALVAFDIETDGAQVLCIGFAWSGRQAATVPLTRGGWGGDKRATALAWATVKSILALPIAKVTHNGLFDTYMLAWQGVRVKRWLWDTCGMHHQLNPNRRHSLAYCSSVDLRNCFWKEEAKELSVGPRGGVSRRWSKDLPGLMRYCGKDCRATWRLQRVYEKQLTSTGTLSTYIAHHRRMNRACLDLSLTGVPIDEEVRAHHHQKWESEKAHLRIQLKEVSGEDLVAKKSLSSTRVLKYFYETLGCKGARKRGTGRPTADEVAIRRLMLKYKKARPVGQLVLDFRHAQKMSEFVEEGRVSSDGRLRSLYRPLTKTGRCMSAKTPMGEGTNLQNQAREVRDMFASTRPGWLFGSLDLSQAESRIVDGSSGDSRALELARTPPDQLDQHALMASEVLGIAIEHVDKLSRDVVGKTGRHATNYGEGGAMMSDSLLKNTESRVVRTPEECQEIIDAIMAKRPYIGTWQHWVRGRGIEERKLQNSWGCVYVTPWWGVGEQDYKEWYAWGPQGEVGRLLNQWGWLPARSLIRKEGLHVEIVMQNHDDLVFYGTPGALWIVMDHASRCLSVEREYPGVRGGWTLAMPVGWKVGHSWGEMQEWKVPPRRERFLEIAHGIVKGDVDGRVRSGRGRALSA